MTELEAVTLLFHQLYARLLAVLRRAADLRGSTHD